MLCVFRLFVLIVVLRLQINWTTPPPIPLQLYGLHLAVHGPNMQFQLGMLYFKKTMLIGHIDISALATHEMNL